MSKKEIRVSIVYNHWYHKFFDFFNKFKRKKESIGNVGTISFDINFDKKGKVIEGVSRMFIDKKIRFLKRKPKNLK